MMIGIFHNKVVFKGYIFFRYAIAYLIDGSIA